MNSRWTTRLAWLAAMAAGTACSDSTGTTGGQQLSAADKTVLTTALAASGVSAGAGTAGSYAPLALAFLGESGPLGTSASAAVASAVNAALRGTMAATYEGAFGVQVIYSSTGVTGTWTGIVGWDGLDVVTSSVNEFIQVGAATASLTPVAGSSSTTIGGTAGGYASYWTAATNSRYDGTSGAFVLTSASFPGAEVDCSSVSSTSLCTAASGTISGNFAFSSSRASGTGPTTYDQLTVNFTSLPAVRLTVAR